MKSFVHVTYDPVYIGDVPDLNIYNFPKIKINLVVLLGPRQLSVLDMKKNAAGNTAATPLNFKASKSGFNPNT